MKIIPYIKNLLGLRLLTAAKLRWPCYLYPVFATLTLTFSTHAEEPQPSKALEALHPSEKLKSTEALETPEEFRIISGAVVMELQNEYAVDSDNDTRDGDNDLFFRTEVAPVIQFHKNIFIDGVAVLENINDRKPNTNNTFESEGIFMEELKVNFEKDGWAAFAGKFNPGFGIAWDYGRGIWSEDFAEDYEITERIGLGGSYTYEHEDFGIHTLTASTFFADTTFLSQSVISKRDRVNKDDGGVSNTEDFSSFVISLEGENLASIENLYYKLAYRSQSEGDADSGGDDETGYAATLGYIFPFTELIELDALVEFVDIENFDAGTDDNEYFAASLVTTFDAQWNLTIGYTSREIDVKGDSDIDDHLIQVSAGYDFGQGTTIEIGWRGTEESGDDTDIIGGLIRHTFEF